ncbi:P27 family phage terminase small subunit [Ensifer sp. 2YAB10]|uniref:P27 family phage terminase small subunit n=1 Tax=unclassified Ensifer TaxID=2633371 RepID=UPI003F93769F
MVGVKGRSGGRNRKPDALKALEGNRGHRTKTELEAKPPSIQRDLDEYHFISSRPPWPEDDQRRLLWQKLKLAVPLSHWNGAGEAMLEMAAQAWFDHRRMVTEAERQGAIIHDKDGTPRRNPALIVARQALADFVRLSSALGIGHNARAGLVASGVQPIDWIAELERAEMMQTQGGGTGLN